MEARQKLQEAFDARLQENAQGEEQEEGENDEDDPVENEEMDEEEQVAEEAPTEEIKESPSPSLPERKTKSDLKPPPLVVEQPSTVLPIAATESFPAFYSDPSPSMMYIEGLGCISQFASCLFHSVFYKFWVPTLHASRGMASKTGFIEVDGSISGECYEGVDHKVVKSC